MIIIHDLNNINNEWHYMDNLGAKNALIYCHMVENNLTSQLHDDKAKAKIEALIVEGRRFLTIGNLTVKKDQTT